MRRKRIITTLLLLNGLFCSVAFSQTIKLTSPNGKLQFRLWLEETPVYEISFNKKQLINKSSLSLNFDSGSFGSDLRINKPSYRTGKETYELVVGKASTIHSHYKEVVIPLQEKNSLKRTVHVAVRAFDDGIAFRYEFPEQSGWDSYIMYDEKTEFNLAGDPKATALFFPSYISTHEGVYTKTNYSSLDQTQLMDLPVMFQYDDMYLAITEAAVRDYAGMYLMKETGCLISKLSPSLTDPNVKVIADLPHQSPWRVCMISDRVGALIESNILTNLNEPCKIEDTSWINPGKTTFTWWSGNIVPDTTFMAGNNFETNKYYIDFAARNNLQYHSIYGFAETPWYTDNGFNYGWPGTNVDITQPIAPLNMKHICDYAASQGVGIHVWVHWKPLYEKLDEAFAKFEEWGIKGMMVDFMDRDDQEMIRIQEEILQKAARHKLFIQFHGSSKPSGLHRTYPNEFTREGALNYEVYKWDTTINADHDISMPFTRLLAGATDYHLGGFRSLPASEFKIQYLNPYVTSTRCHMLAMYVVLESYLGMVCDTPQAYEGQPGFEFIQHLPTVWDETVVPDASVNEYVVIARRNGDDWYIGSINNSMAREVDLSFGFLPEGVFQAEIYTDSNDVNINPNHLTKSTREITKRDRIKLPLASEGGSVICLRKIK